MRENVIQINGEIMINVEVSVKNVIYLKKIILRILLHAVVDTSRNCVTELYNEKTKTIPTNFNEKKAICKMQNFYILLAFLLITTALLIAVSI